MNVNIYTKALIVVLIFEGTTGVLSISALKGSTVQLTCPHRPSNIPISWRYFDAQTGTSLAYSLDDRISPNLPNETRERLAITGQPNNYHLNISNIRESDQGNYECDIAGTNQITKKELIVIVGPTNVNIDMKQGNNILGIENKSLTIKCTAEGGQPKPDIKLTVSGFSSTDKQSVQLTFTPQRIDDGSSVLCEAGYKNINHFPLSSTASIKLKLKPIVTPFAPATLSTKEATYFYVSCPSNGSRPAASMYWFLGEKNITSNSTSQPIHDTPADTYTVTSDLRYRTDRNNNRQKLTCRASNDAGSTETSLTLNVKYAPGVIVENKTFLQTQTSRQIPSTIDSNPQVNTCTWRHKSKYGEIIRDFSNNNQILTLPTVTADKMYQDTGEYVCTCENGILGINGQLNQTGSGYVISNAVPVITVDNKDSSTQYGKFGNSTKVYINVYSIPKYSSISWYIGDTQLVPNKYVFKEEHAIVKDVFHGVDVQLDGYRVTLTISHLQEADFTNYTLRLYHSTGSQYVQHQVTLESASAPQTPSNFTLTSSGETSVTFQWIPGYDGGQTQTFNIEYHISGTDTWMSQEIEIGKKIDLHNIYTLSGLRDKTTYELRMYAKNKFNQSQYTDIETITTLSKEKSTALGGVIGGVAGGLVAVIVILALIAFVLFKRKQDSGFPSKRTRSKSDSEVEEGLKDNILYDGSEPEGLKVNELYQSAGPDSINTGPNAEYAEVSKPYKKTSKSTNDEYAEVQKQNDVYAEVDKKTQPKNVKKKKQKDKKKAPKSAKTKDGALNNNPDGEYANSGNPMGSMSDGAYYNAENQSVGIKKNDQGLEYADLTFGSSKIPKGKQPVIHGDENRTIYSDVDHTKKAPPPPQESEYEETDIRHGKK